MELVALHLHIGEELVGHRTRTDGAHAVARRIEHGLPALAAVVADLPAAVGVDAEFRRHAVGSSSLHGLAVDLDAHEALAVLVVHRPVALGIDADHGNHGRCGAALMQGDNLAVAQRQRVGAVRLLHVGNGRTVAHQLRKGLDVLVQRHHLGFESRHTALQVVHLVPQAVGVVIASRQADRRRQRENRQEFFHEFISF